MEKEDKRWEEEQQVQKEEDGGKTLADKEEREGGRIGGVGG